MSPANLHLQKYSILPLLIWRILICFFSFFLFVWWLPSQRGGGKQRFAEQSVVNYSGIRPLCRQCRTAAEINSDSQIHQQLIWKPGRRYSFDGFCLEPVRANRPALNQTRPPTSSILFKQTPFWLFVETPGFGGILLSECVFNVWRIWIWGMRRCFTAAEPTKIGKEVFQKNSLSVNRLVLPGYVFSDQGTCRSFKVLYSLTFSSLSKRPH